MLWPGYDSHAQATTESAKLDFLCRLPRQTKGGVIRWFSNPVLLEWDESTPWCDAERLRGYEELLQLSRRIAVRIVPWGAVLFMTGFWLVGRIPGGGGPMSYHQQLIVAGPWLLFWSFPYIALRLGLAKPTQGTCTHVRLHVRGIQFVAASHTVKRIDWSLFDAFELGRLNDFDVLKLSLRGTCFSRIFGRQSVAVEYGASRVPASSIREVLLDRGLDEETLNEPFVNRQLVPLT